MKIVKKSSFFLLSSLIVFASVFIVQCRKDNNEGDFPDIDIVSPGNCDTIYTGDFLNFEADFSGTTPLSAYSIDIHNDFDQHIHQGSDLNCKQSAKKNTSNPFIYLQLYDFPANTTSYESSLLINIPESIDTGDYHVYIRLANVEGYQTNSNVSIKILHKP
ncbi:MAG TPA: DUF4625 domain-containing protein [Bacteroidales bacterium]